MTRLGDAALRQLASTVITRYAGSGADAAAIAGAARRAYEELVRVSAPLIGTMGVEALTRRAVHLARRDHSWLADAPGEQGPFDSVVVGVENRESASGADGAATVLASLGGLLASLIGEGLTSQLLREAWPIGSLGEPDQERNTK